MAIRRTGYSMPMGSAGIMSAGKGSTGGIPMSPKFVLAAAVIFILLVLILGKVMAT